MLITGYVVYIRHGTVIDNIYVCVLLVYIKIL